jgi:hypothetical protein
MSRIKVDLISNELATALEENIERVNNALSLGEAGVYGFDQYFRDWFQGYAKAVRVSHGICQIVIDPSRLFPMEGKVGEKGVTESFPVSTPAKMTLDNNSFTPIVGKGSIPFTATPTRNRKSIVVTIPSLASAKKGTYEGKVYDKANPGDVRMSLTLTVA